jgi:hypothetical protein
MSVVPEIAVCTVWKVRLRVLGNQLRDRRARQTIARFDPPLKITNVGEKSDLVLLCRESMFRQYLGIAVQTVEF